MQMNCICLRIKFAVAIREKRSGGLDFDGIVVSGSLKFFMIRKDWKIEGYKRNGKRFRKFLTTRV